MLELRTHGGQGRHGLLPHDFSTNRNGCGACPLVVRALQGVDASHYPDPSYEALREGLAAFHQVAVDRIVLAASASEFIFRFSAMSAQFAHQQGRTATVEMPQHGYGDYAHAAKAWNLASSAAAWQSDLIWACDPSSPHGQVQAGLAQRVDALQSGQNLVLDGAYRPLRLEGELALSDDQLNTIWQLWSPNKALGVTGVRAAYAIAPLNAAMDISQLARLAPSWLIGAHGCAMLASWTDSNVQDWVVQCRSILSQWKARQIEVCEAMGWTVSPSVANFFLAEFDSPDHVQLLDALQSLGIQLRDATSFGLPGKARMGILPPASQDALWQAYRQVSENR